MKKYWLAALAALLLTCNAWALDGKVYFGLFDTDSLRAQSDGTSIARYITGVEIGHEIEKLRLRPYVELITLMDEYHGDSRTFHPASIEYKIGLDFNVWEGLYLKGEHSCWHPVDSGGTVEVYNLLQIEYRF
jgi:hypothetical protein